MISAVGKDIIPRMHIEPDSPASHQVRRLVALDWAVEKCPHDGSQIDKRLCVRFYGERCLVISRYCLAPIAYILLTLFICTTIYFD